MVFQDSYASLNPHMPIEENIAIGRITDGIPYKEAMELSIDLMSKVRLESPSKSTENKERRPSPHA